MCPSSESFQPLIRVRDILPCGCRFFHEIVQIRIRVFHVVVEEIDESQRIAIHLEGLQVLFAGDTQTELFVEQVLVRVSEVVFVRRNPKGAELFRVQMDIGTAFAARVGQLSVKIEFRIHPELGVPQIVGCPVDF